MAITFAKSQNSKKLLEFSKILNWIKKPRPLLWFYFMLVGLGFLYLITALIFNDFTTPFSGDYVSQQFAFYTNGYDDWHHFFKTGEFIFYDTNTFLGANNIGSNSFYYLFDPFFAPILLVPRQYVPQGMAVLTIFKLATAGIVFYAYMRTLGVSKGSSKISATAYAFCGWTTWYLWFNHFTEVAICLPLILLGIEKVLKEKNPLFLSFGILIAGLTNFFFMLTFCIVAFIYAMWRYFQRLKLNNAKENLIILGIGALSFITGILLSCVVVLPSAMVALESDRASSDNYLELLKTALENHDISTLFDILFSWKNIKAGREYRSLFPFVEFFYPVMSDRGTPLTKFGNETYDNVAGSIYCFIPLIILLTPAMIRSIREKKYSHLVALILFLVALCTPFAYYLFHGFTQAYSRWTLFVSASLIAYVGIYLDKFKEDPSWYISIGGIVAVMGVILGAVAANVIIQEGGDNMSPRNDVFWAMFGMVLYTSLVTIILRMLHQKSYVHTLIHTFVCVEVVVMGAFTIYGHGLTEYKLANNGLDNNNALYSLVNKINENDDSYYRSWSGIEGDSAKNSGMRNDYNSASFFHSIYNFNVMNFIEWSKIVNSTNGWSGSYVEKRMDLDTFLGMKYYYILKESLDYERLGVTYEPNAPIGFKDISNQFPNEKFFVFENKEHIELGFSYDSLINYNSSENERGFLSSNREFGEIANEVLYLEHAILDYKDIEEIKELYPHFNEETLNTSPSFDSSMSRIIPSYKSKSSMFSIDAYLNAVPNVNNRNITYSQIIDAIKGESVDVPSGSNRNDDIILVIEPNSGYEFPYDPSGVAYYLDINYKLNYKHDVYFVGENDELITMDRHSDNYVSDSNSRRDVRGFYLKPTIDEDGNVLPAKRLKKIILVPRYGGVYTNNDIPYYPFVYQKVSDRNDSYMNEIREYPLENVIYKTNKFSFDTDYEHNRFICTQIAFDDGWKVFVINSNGEKEEVKTYLTQGGFVGFVSSVGETHYEMIYETPYLKLGNTLSIIGGFIFIFTMVSYYYISVELNKKKLITELL